MSYLHFFSIHNLALLSDWLEENRELLIDVYHPHSGGGSFQYFIHSIEDLKQLIRNQTHPEIEITIFRQKQYSLRGIANEEMLEKAFCNIKDGEYYSIISLENNFPNSINFLEAGNGHSELRHNFSEFEGQEIGFGKNPFDAYDDKWFRENSSEFFRLSVTKSYNYHGNYVKNPEKYKWLEDFWLE